MKNQMESVHLPEHWYFIEDNFWQRLIAFTAFFLSSVEQPVHEFDELAKSAVGREVGRGRRERFQIYLRRARPRIRTGVASPRAATSTRDLAPGTARRLLFGPRPNRSTVSDTK